MFKVLLATGLLGALAQECVKDNRLNALTKNDFRVREQIQGFSKDGMWKMPKVAQKATEEQLEDCASCTDAEVQVELMQAQIGENPLLNEIDGIYYPVQNMYAQNGFKLNYKDIPHEVHPKVKQLLEHRMGSLTAEITAYRQFTEGDAERLLKNHEEVEHLAPSGLGPLYQEMKAAESKKKTPSLMVKTAQKSFAEYASHVRVLRDIEKSSTKGSGIYMILREGMIISPNFKTLFKKTLASAPKDWDILFMRKGAQAKNPVRCEDKTPDSTNIYEMRRPVRTPDGSSKFYQGIDGYVIRKQSIGKVLKMLRNSKAGPLSELLMSVHTEEKSRRADGKTDYKVDGIYSYMVVDQLLDTVAIPQAPKPAPPKAEVKQQDKEGEEKKDEKNTKETPAPAKRDLKQAPAKPAAKAAKATPPKAKFLQTV